MNKAFQKFIPILLAVVWLSSACAPREATQPPFPVPAPSVVIPATPAETSPSTARTDCATRYPTGPAARTNWPRDDWSISTLEEHCLDRAMIEKAAWYFEQNHATSSLLIVRHGELVYERYFFQAIPQERRVHIFSITKSFLSALTGIAMDLGILDSLDHKVVEYFPEYFYSTTDPRMRLVTLRELLTMSGGFQWEEDGPIEARWMETGNLVEASINLDFMDEPGTAFNYSSAHTQLLSAILTKLAGEPLRDFAQRTLFSPLGIASKDWSWGRDDQGYYLGGWGIHIRTRDLARFGYLYLNGGVWDGQQVVPQEWVAESTSPQIATGYGSRYGYLWWVHPSEHVPTYEAIGYGGQSLYIVPSLDMVIVVTGNVSGGNQAGAPSPNPIITEWIIKAVTDR
jgi:CubicO group peptidase (beta-lactamase class C family)